MDAGGHKSIEFEHCCTAAGGHMAVNVLMTCGSGNSDITSSNVIVKTSFSTNLNVEC
jgi:hypothetical protein